METRFGSIEGVWSLLNRTKDDGEGIVRCCWGEEGGKKSNLGTVRCIVVAQTRYCNLGSIILFGVDIFSCIRIFEFSSCLLLTITRVYIINQRFFIGSYESTIVSHCQTIYSVSSIQSFLRIDYNNNKQNNDFI